MSEKRKRRFQTWADAELAHEIAERMSGVLEIAIRALVHGNVKWLQGEQPRKIGLCKLDAPHGGVVIIVERDMVGARYLDDWLNHIQTLPAPSTSKQYMPSYKAWLDLRRLAAKAKEEQLIVHQRLVEEAKGGVRIPLAPIVDQNVRQY